MTVRTAFQRAGILALLLCSACGSSSPTAPATPAPTPTPTPAPAPTPTPILTVQTVACPDVTVGVDVAFYRQIGCGAFDQPSSPQPVRRWNIAPKVYLRTVDEAGAAIDPLTLDTVQNAMIETAMAWTGNHFGLEGVLRGTDTREGQTGWVTVKWPATAAAAPSCGRSQVAADGGWIELNYKVGGGCACNGSAIRPRTVRHELGHAFGYWHTDSATDLMSGLQVTGCDGSPSARELQAAAYQYR